MYRLCVCVCNPIVAEACYSRHCTSLISSFIAVDSDSTTCPPSVHGLDSLKPPVLVKTPPVRKDPVKPGLYTLFVNIELFTYNPLKSWHRDRQLYSGYEFLTTLSRSRYFREKKKASINPASEHIYGPQVKGGTAPGLSEISAFLTF